MYTHTHTHTHTHISSDSAIHVYKNSTSRNNTGIHVFLSIQINDINTSFSNHNTHHYAMHAHVLFLVLKSRSISSLVPRASALDLLFL